MARSVSPATALRDAYRRLQERVARAAARAGRRDGEVAVVAVTKNASPDQIRLLVELGHADLGENRVQQLIQRVAMLEEFLSRKRMLGGSEEGKEKTEERRTKSEERRDRSQGARRGHFSDHDRRPAASEARNAERGTRNVERGTAVPGAGTTAGAGVRWHMVGHLQRNKVKLVVPLVKLIHSVDSLRLAEELHSFGARRANLPAGKGVRMILSPAGGAVGGAPEQNHPDPFSRDALPSIDVLLQVNTANDPRKYGVAAPAALHLAEQIDSMIHLRLRGLMTIAPYSERAEDSRGLFAHTRELFEEIRGARIAHPHFSILSMGMSHDFEVAIEEGANVIRVGRVLFGEGEGGTPGEDPLDLRTAEPGAEEEGSEE